MDPLAPTPDAATPDASGRTAQRVDPVPDLVEVRRRALEQLTRRVATLGGTRSRSPLEAVGSSSGFVGRTGARRWLALAVVAVVVLSAPWWWQLRRPRPAEDTLPRADRTSTTASPSAPTTGPVPAADPATGTSGSGAATGGAPADGAPLVVHVVGAVVRPGVLRLGTGTRVVDAVDAAGGLRPDADVARINLAAPLADGQRVVVPVVGQEPPVEVAPTPAVGAGGTGGGPTVSGAPVDLNTATVAQLDELPGIGPATATAIVTHRDRLGRFASVEDLLDVRGIGPAKLEALRDLVRVG